MAKPLKRWWRYGRAFLIPLVLWGLVAFTLWEPIELWLRGSESQDRDNLREWLEEGNTHDTLPGMTEELVRLRKQVQSAESEADRRLAEHNFKLEHEKIVEHLKSMGELTKMHSGQLPLFPVVYRIEIHFDSSLQLDPLCWDSHLSDDESQRKQLDHSISEHARVTLFYQLHAFAKQQQEKEVRAVRARNLSLLAILATGLAVGWMVYQQRHAHERDRQRAQAQHHADQAELHRQQEELRRQDADHRREEAERDLLHERLAAQTSERRLLEMKSQLYASIGIMAGSYAHNIKNLLVRPNDLLQRCMEDDGLDEKQTQMLREVRGTLGTVTERLQLILRTVRRDPSQSELEALDLGEVLRDLDQTWKQLAWEKWKLSLTLAVRDEPLIVHADRSHLQQAIENLLFNARDATFEMRNHLRETARNESNGDQNAQRQAIIAAAAWKGEVSVRVWKNDDHVILEVQDNGVGMTEEVRRHCTETHFSTKRDDATYEGHGAGMGLGLSFVTVILEHHHAELEIDSEPKKGTTFRVRFPTVA